MPNGAFWRFLAHFGAFERGFMTDLYAPKKFTTTEPTKRGTRHGDAHQKGRGLAVLPHIVDVSKNQSRTTRRLSTKFYYARCLLSCYGFPSFSTDRNRENRADQQIRNSTLGQQDTKLVLCAGPLT